MHTSSSEAAEGSSGAALLGAGAGAKRAGLSLATVRQSQSLPSPPTYTLYSPPPELTATRPNWTTCRTDTNFSPASALGSASAVPS